MFTKFLLLMLISSLPVYAQLKPDTGQQLQELKKPLMEPAPRTPIKIESPEKVVDKVAGPTVILKSVSIKGNTIFSSELLSDVLGKVEGLSLTLGEIKEFASKITNHYRKNGYPFAKVVIPPQKISEGHLVIEVYEGKYGEIRLVGEKELTDRIRSFTDTLVPGTVIANGELERVTQIIDDLPGISQTPIIRPSQTLGAGDLIIDIKSEKRVNARVGINNYGNAYTGRVQNSLGVEINRVFTIGDQFSSNGVITEENMWLGNLKYEMPIFSRGLRANAGYTHTFYQLKKEFSYLEASGRGNIFSAGVSYPIIKSQIRNIPISATVSHKRLSDKQNAVLIKEYKSVNSLAINLSGDNRDRVLGSGITYGTLGMTLGKLILDNALRTTDQQSADSEGGFVKYNLNVARLQVLPAGFLFFQEFAFQLSSKNLDSSEGFGAGGTSGVRAYPSGEGYGDEGFTSQSEIRYSLKNMAPFIFFDYGRTKINHSNYSTARNYRNIAGTGAGVRGQYKDLSTSIMSAWRTQGGKSQSYSKSYIPMIWLNAEYRF